LKGAEAVSDLARAFFYAGACALLVSLRLSMQLEPPNTIHGSYDRGRFALTYLAHTKLARDLPKPAHVFAPFHFLC
jgi:hypothetical protein